MNEYHFLFSMFLQLFTIHKIKCFHDFNSREHKHDHLAEYIYFFCLFFFLIFYLFLKNRDEIRFKNFFMVFVLMQSNFSRPFFERM